MADLPRFASWYIDSHQLCPRCHQPAFRTARGVFVTGDGDRFIAYLHKLGMERDKAGWVRKLFMTDAERERLSF